MELLQLGWDAHFEVPFGEYRECGLQAGRVSIQHRDLYHLMTTDGEVEGIVTGRLRHEASSPADFPAVGDWVAFQQVIWMVPSPSKPFYHDAAPFRDRRPARCLTNR